MPHSKTIYCYNQNTDKKLCAFTNQEQRNHLILSQPVSQRKHVNVKQAEKVKEHRNSRKPWEIPVRYKQMVNQTYHNRQYQSQYCHILYKFPLCLKQKHVFQILMVYNSTHTETKLSLTSTNPPVIFNLCVSLCTR